MINIWYEFQFSDIHESTNTRCGVQCLWETFQAILELHPSKLKWIVSLITWTASSEFVSSSIPSWQILTAHARPFRGARDLAFCLKVPLDSLLVWASSEGSGETAQMRRLAWTFAARICYKYQIRLMRSTYILGIFPTQSVGPGELSMSPQQGMCYRPS